MLRPFMGVTFSVFYKHAPPDGRSWCQATSRLPRQKTPDFDEVGPRANGRSQRVCVKDRSRWSFDSIQFDQHAAAGP